MLTGPDWHAYRLGARLCDSSRHFVSDAGDGGRVKPFSPVQRTELGWGNAEPGRDSPACRRRSQTATIRSGSATARALARWTARAPCRRSICLGNSSRSAPSAPQRRPVQRPRDRHPPHKCPLERTLIGTTGRWLPSTAGSSRNEPITSGNAPAAGCSRCQGRRAAALIMPVVPQRSGASGRSRNQRFRRLRGPSGQGQGRTADLPLFSRFFPCRDHLPGTA
jgi:hypothetical protein